MRPVFNRSSSPAVGFDPRPPVDVVEKCIKIFVKAGLEIHNGPRQDKAHHSFQPFADRWID
jgi:hypothetical protein